VKKTNARPAYQAAPLLVRAAAVLAVLLAQAIGAGASLAADVCDGTGLKIQVLGSGGPDLSDGRAATGYVVWIDGKARALVDSGPGTALRFAASGARAADLDVVLFTHLHADHTTDLPAILSIALQQKRVRTLPLWGPTGNRVAPATVNFVRTLLDSTRGAYRQFGDLLSPMVKEGFKLDAQEVRHRPSTVGVRREDTGGIIEIRPSERMQTAAVYIVHGAYPALAWRIRVGDRAIVFSGDTNGEGGQLELLAKDANLLVAHHAVAEGVAGTERYLHMPPSVIGRVAAEAGVKRVVLSHRTRQTLGREEASAGAIRTRYKGPLDFADDLSCFVVP
jgi:ribonuclease BN (tRNA processing enzyme)